MLHAFDPVSYDAYERLLAQPDPPDLPHRGHAHRYDGDPNRRSTLLPGIVNQWLQRRHLTVDEAGL